MNDYGLTEKDEVKKWYDGFIFGDQHNIYNPWSIIGYLSNKLFDTYWADTSTNSLVSDLLAHSDASIKKDIEILLGGKSILTKLDEQIIFTQLYNKKGALWSLLLAAGYLKPVAVNRKTKEYLLEITNLETKLILENKISEWFNELNSNDGFLKALLNDDLEMMNELMTEIAESNFSYFDTQSKIKNDRKEAESFYHGFVLGLLINFKGRYNIISNRESGFGRYDICMYPLRHNDHGIIIEFKSIMLNQEKDLNEACRNALRQINEKDYIKDLLNQNISRKNIYIYGFAFQGKKVKIYGGAEEKLDWSAILNKHNELS